MTRALRVLLVEDDPPTTDFMQMALALRGHAVTACADGAEALALLEARPTAFDVVLLDMAMPVMDGVETVRRLRRRAETRELPIVAISAKASGKTCDEAMAAGVDLYLRKPCFEESIVAAIWEAIELRVAKRPVE